MRPRPELRQLLICISTSRYLPASGTAGLDRSFVSGNSRVPAPPPMMIANVLFWREYKSIRSEFLADSLLGTLQASQNFVTMDFSLCAALSATSGRRRVLRYSWTAYGVWSIAVTTQLGEGCFPMEKWRFGSGPAGLIIWRN